VDPAAARHQEIADLLAEADEVLKLPDDPEAEGPPAMPSGVAGDQGDFSTRSGAEPTVHAAAARPAEEEADPERTALEARLVAVTSELADRKRVLADYKQGQDEKIAAKLSLVEHEVRKTLEGDKHEGLLSRAAAEALRKKVAAAEVSRAPRHEEDPAADNTVPTGLPAEELREAITRAEGQLKELKGQEQRIDTQGALKLGNGIWKALEPLITLMDAHDEAFKGEGSELRTEVLGALKRLGVERLSENLKGKLYGSLEFELAGELKERHMATLADALMTMPVPEDEPEKAGTVAEVFRAGYYVPGRGIARPASVAVYTG
jgi:hypothetical protein